MFLGKPLGVLGACSPLFSTLGGSVVRAMIILITQGGSGIGQKLITQYVHALLCMLPSTPHPTHTQPIKKKTALILDTSPCQGYLAEITREFADFYDF